MYKSISFHDEDFTNKLIQEFKSDGLVVINSVFSDEEADQLFNNIIDDFMKLCTEIDKNNIKDTWKPENIPQETKSGLFQTLIGNLHASWTVRLHSNVRKMFETLYSEFRQSSQTDFIVSGDGINLKSGQVGPYKARDWPHLDQTYGDIYKCVQGQAVLTNSSACFVTSPKSHLLFDRIIEALGINNTSNWLKFDDKQIKIVKQIVAKELWQIPIMSTKGSFIVWSSTLIHSARFQPKYEDNWRCIVYVCMRPRIEFTEQELNARADAFTNNKVTNHWSQKIFTSRPGNPQFHKTKNEHMEMLMDNPTIVYNILGKPHLTQDQLRMVGF